MGSFSLSGGVEVFGFISPSNTSDQYPVIDPLYGIDGLRNVNLLSDLDSIPLLRRRAGMVVGVSGGTTYYKLNSPPWNSTISDWSIFNSGGGTFTGGTVTGDTIFTNGLTATTFSASTYLGLPSDVYVSGYSYSNNTFTIERSFGNPNLSAIINDVTGLTINGDLNVTGTTISDIISASTYQNLPLDIFVTGGTFSGGVITFENNSGGTFGVSGISSFDTFVTGFTYNDNTLTILQNSGNSFSVLVDTFTGLTINGDLNVTGTTYTDSISANTYQNLPLDVFVTGGTYSAGTATFANNSGGTFNVNGFLKYFISPTTPTGATDGDRWFNTNEGRELVYVTDQDGSQWVVPNGTSSLFGSLSATTISATTYQNLPIDPNTYVTGFSYNNNTFTIEDNSGSTFNATFNDVTGLTINGDLNVTGDTTLNGLTATTISAGTYQNLPLDVFVTGFSYSDNTFTIYQNSGSPLNATIDSVTGLTVNGTLNSTTFSGGTYFGDGSNLNGIIRGSGGGRLFYFNLSNTQSPYYEFSPSATTLVQQSITTSAITSGSTSTIAGFLTPPNVPDVFLLPGGIWSFYLHSYAEDISSSFEIFCEVYQRTTGGTEVFLFQTDATPITSYSPNPSMSISDSYYSGASLDFSDRLLVKVNVTNLGTSSKTVTFVTEDGIHYSYSTTSLIIPVVDTFTTGFTYNDNTLTIQRNEGLSDLSVTINSVTGLTINGDLSVTGTTSSGIISATTYQNLPTDIRVTGGTYSNGTATFTNNVGSTFNVSGFYTGATDVFVTGATYDNNIFTYTNNSGGTFDVSFDILSGLTINGDLNITGTTYTDTISATTYQNLPIDPNTYVTGFSYNNNTFTIIDNLGGTFDTTFNVVTGLTINGNLNATGNTTLNGLTANTISATTYQNLPTDIRVTGGTYSAGTTTFTNNTGGTFNVTGFVTGDTFATGYSYSNNTFTINQNNGQPNLTATIDSVTGLTSTGKISSSIISATTYQGFANAIYPVGTIQPLLQSNDFSTTTGTMQINRLVGYYITIEKNISIDTLYVRAGTTNAGARITYGIYSINSVGYPNSKLFNSTEFTLAVSTSQTQAVSWSLSAGTYFVAANMNSSSGGMIGFSRFVIANTAIGTTDVSASFVPRGYDVATTYSTTLPTTFPAGATSSGTLSLNGLWFRIA